MALQPTRRRYLAGVGLAAAGGTALLSPGQPSGSPTLARTISPGSWPVAGHDPARTKYAPAATPPTSASRVAWTASVPLSNWLQRVTVDAQRVYVATPAGVTALDRADGSLRWRFDTADYWPPDGISLTVGPLVAADRVLIGTAAAIVAVDAATGRVQWARPVDRVRRAVLVGDALYLPAHEDGPELLVVDVATGGVWHRFSTATFRSPVAYVDGALLAAGADTLASFDPRTGERRWQAPNPAGVDLRPTAVAGGDHVIVGTNPVIAVDATTGRERWRHTFPTGDNESVQFRPATDGDRVYVSAYWATETVAFDAATGDVVWRVPDRLGDPVVAGGTVYCADGDGITALVGATGDRRGRLGGDLTPADVGETLAVAGDRLYLGFAPGEDTRTQSTLFALEAP